MTRFLNLCLMLLGLRLVSGALVPHSAAFFDIGNDAPAPDPLIGEAAKSNSAIASRQQDLAEQQYGDQKALLAEYAPLLKDLIAKNVVAQDKATQQSDDAWADYNKTWKPVEQRLASESLSYLDPARGEQEAARAASDTTSAFTQQREASARSLAAAGASPERIAAAEAAGRLVEAKAVGGAQSLARRDTAAKGLSYLDNAARFGRNMPSTGIATAQLAGQSGQAAQGSVSGLQGATAAPVSYAAPLFNSAVSANSSAGNLALSGYNAQLQANQQNNAAFGDMLGAGASLLGMSKMGGTGANAGAQGLGMLASIFSAEELKDVGAEVDGEKASVIVAKTPAKHWAYKPGLGDGSTKQRMGPMAGALRDATGGVVSDGTTIDGIAFLGLHHAAIGGQHQRLARIEKRLGLADARRD